MCNQIVILIKASFTSFEEYIAKIEKFIVIRKKKKKIC
jgi:hypothetical protein